MLRLTRFFGERARRLLLARVRLPLPTAAQVMGCLSILGRAGLSFVGGAAVMHFHLPPSDFLDKAFVGGEAWHERGRPDVPPPSDYASGMAHEGVRLDRPDRTCDGFTLFTTTAGSWARLVDMKGREVHRWEFPFRRAWPHPPHVADPVPDVQVHWFRAHAYPNGDLLAVYHASGDTPYGYGLVKLDRDSNLLWAYAGNVHHDVDVAEDGTIYTLEQKLVSQAPPGLEALPGPLIADDVLVLSPDGRLLDRLPLLEAFRDSPYAQLLLTALDLSPGNEPSVQDTKGDLLHANSVRVLSHQLARKFPLFKPGDVLVSLRSPSTVAVLDPHTRSVAWAARGAWQYQHDAEFLANGHLLLYDNFGSSHGSRVLEYDPITQAIPWEYSNENAVQFRASSRGMKQRLPNGNTLIIDPEEWLLLEVTPDKQVVWEECCGAIVTGARRYLPEDLPFLKGEARARP